jgi:hypothetical protein
MFERVVNIGKRCIGWNPIEVWVTVIPRLGAWHVESQAPSARIVMPRCHIGYAFPVLVATLGANPMRVRAYWSFHRECILPSLALKI